MTGISIEPAAAGADDWTGTISHPEDTATGAISEEGVPVDPGDSAVDPWDRPDADDPPVLSSRGIEGPPDWWLGRARSGAIDLRAVSMADLADDFAENLEAAFAHAPKPPLGIWGDWLVMVAMLLLLRTRPVADPVSPSAVRNPRAHMAEMRAAADWLDRREHLGRDVFARGRSEAGLGDRRSGDLTALLRACLVALAVPPEVEERYRLPAPPLYSMADATARITTLLRAHPKGGPLGAFLPPPAPNDPDPNDPDPNDLAPANPAPVDPTQDSPTRDDPKRRNALARSAYAATFVAGLELARKGIAELEQRVEDIALRAAQPVA